MNVNDVQSLFAFDAWANRRIVDAAARLTPEQFTRDLGASFGSVRGTLIHIMWGEKRWLYRWVHGDAVDRLPDPAPVNVRGVTYSLADLVKHITNHSTYHRGQVVLLLRQLGEKPPATDYRLFVSERPSDPSPRSG